MEVFIARQPIFDRTRRVYGYELLFGAYSDSTKVGLPDAAQGDAAQANGQVIADSVFAVGLDNLRGDRNAFVSFDRRMLLEEWYAVLPPKTTVIEIHRSIPFDPEVVGACQRIASLGYSIAVNGPMDRAEYEGPHDFARIIKVEALRASRPYQEEMVYSYHASGLKVIAEEVETYEQFEWAGQAGYDYFQGHFFARPTVLRGRQIQPVKIIYLRVLREIQKPELDFNCLTTLISEDVALSYKLMRYASSALFSRRGQIRSVRHALVSLGETNIRRWLALVMLSKLSEDKPGELITYSLLRARFCESMAKVVRPQIQLQAFLMGLFSLLDALLDRPLEDVLAEMNLPSAIVSALLNLAPHHDLLGGLYRLVCAYEAGRWTEVDSLVNKFRIPPALVRWAYGEAVHWADEAVMGTHPARIPPADARQKFGPARGSKELLPLIRT